MLEKCVRAKTCLLLKQAEINNLKVIYSCQAGQPGQIPGVFDEAIGSITLQVAISKLIEAKSSGNRRGNYVKSLQYYLSRFAVANESRPVDSFTTDDIQQHLDQFEKPEYRKTWLTRLSTLFAFCVIRGWCEKNPCDRIERIIIDRPPPKILTPAQSQMLLSFAPEFDASVGKKRFAKRNGGQRGHNLQKVELASCVPYVALTMYDGVRPDDEMHKLDWQHINLTTGTARIQSKVRGHNRIVDLEPVTLRILQRYKKDAGLVAPSRSTIRRFKRQVREQLGFSAWPKDVLRHTAASYLMAKYEDMAKISNKLRNSPKILMQHYLEPVTRTEAAGFWNEWPTIKTL